MIKRPAYLLFFLLMAVSWSSWANIGSLLLVSGEVSIQRANQTLTAQTGAHLFEQDKVITRSGRAQLRFSDNTVITLGSNTEFGVEAFLNEGANRSKARFNVAKGTFKVITGQVAKIAPDNFTLQTRTAAIGVRGTIFSGRISEDQEFIATLRGRIFVTENSTGISVDVPAGQITQVKPGEAPQPPRPLTSDDLNQLMPEDSAGNEGGDENQPDEQADNETLPPPDSGDDNSESNPPNQTSPNLDQVLETTVAGDIEQLLANETTLSVTGWILPTAISECMECVTGQGLYYQGDFDVSSTQLVGSFENYIGWGNWQYEDGSSGIWVGGTEAIAAAGYVQNLMSGQTPPTYTYSGQVMGTVFDSTNNSYEINSSTSSVVLVFNFNNPEEPITGNINFNAGAGGAWNVNVNSGWIGSGELAGQFDVGLDSPVLDQAGYPIQSGYAYGQFYGPQAQSVGGVFDLYSYDQTFGATGVFKATR